MAAAKLLSSSSPQFKIHPRNLYLDKRPQFLYIYA